MSRCLVHGQTLRTGIGGIVCPPCLTGLVYAPRSARYYDGPPLTPAEHALLGELELDHYLKKKRSQAQERTS